MIEIKTIEQNLSNAPAQVRSDEDLAKYLNDGWQIIHMATYMRDVNYPVCMVRLQRETKPAKKHIFPDEVFMPDDYVPSEDIFS